MVHEDLSELTFDCPCCGRTQRGLPALAFATPLDYPPLSLWQRLRLGHGANDFYVDKKNGHQFVRCTLSLPIRKTGTGLEWGVWASLSKQNFDRYRATFLTAEQSHLGSMFGWFSSELPGYPSTSAMKCAVHPRDGKMRPWIDLEASDHPLACDFRDGIAVARAIELATPFLQKLHRKQR